MNIIVNSVQTPFQFITINVLKSSPMMVADICRRRCKNMKTCASDSRFFYNLTPKNCLATAISNALWFSEKAHGIPAAFTAYTALLHTTEWRA